MTAWEGNVPDRDSKQVRDYSETHSVSDVLRNEFFQGGLDAPKYPKERETVGGHKAVVLSEHNGCLFGRCGTIPLRWQASDGVACDYGASLNLKPLTPPEPEADPRDDAIDGLKSELRDAARVCWDRGAKEYVRLNYPGWATEWDTPPEPEVMERVKVAVSAAIYKARYRAGVPSPDNVALANLSVDAALSTLTAEGYMVVPVNPTPAMRQAAYDSICRTMGPVSAKSVAWDAVASYRAMLAACAPLLPAEGPTP